MTPVVQTRIIPARAGFTSRLRRRRSQRSDHPRSRGVYHGQPPIWSGRLGSSPLARGLQRLAHTLDTTPGIIPARAGFTRASTSSIPAALDHPRSRGVYHASGPRELPELGSSPLARGLPLAPLGRSHHGGIIPARAGFTLADPRNPNDELPYQAMFTFTADLALAPQSSDSAVVSQRSTTTPSEA